MKGLDDYIPVSDGGLIVNDDTYKFDCRVGLKVAAVQFLNQGVNTNVNISFGGVTITLVPGASQEFNAPVYCYLVSEYDISITAIIPAPAISNNNLRILTQRYVPL
jgi:hypothetical protein